MKVREVIQIIEQDGWYLVRTRGDHRQYKHTGKKRIVTISGNPGQDTATRNTQQRFKTIRFEAGETVKKILIIIEKGKDGYGTYSPDLPGCVAVGTTREEVEERMYEAVSFHLEGLQEDGITIPDNQSIAEYIIIPEPQTTSTE